MSITPFLPRSLRKRFIILSVVLGILILGSSTLVYFNIINSRGSVSEEIRFIDNQLENINEMRNLLIQLQFDIDNYLLDPTQTQLQKRIFANIIEALVLAQGLIDETHAEDQAAKVVEIRDDLLSLQASVIDVLEIRLDVNRQYPAMALSAFQMSAIQDEFQKNMSILLGEIESGVLQPQSAELYPQLLKTRIIWTSLVSQMRIYLANRLASFSTEVLLAQANSAHEISQTLFASIEKLVEIYRDEPDSFEGATAVVGLQHSLRDWLVQFDDMRAKSESPQWRQDWSLMESTIIPLQKKLSLSLTNLESLLRWSERAANVRLESNTDGMFMLAGLIMAAGVLYILTMIISLNLMIFAPIRTLTEAMRAKAFGLPVPPFSARQSEETLLLYEAFEEMDQQVSQRQDALEHQTFHDILTSLPNRIRLNDRLQYLVSKAEQEKGRFLLMVIGIDFFKDITDSIGHQLSDKLVLEFAERLRTVVPETDTLSRIGPDEFALALDGMGCDNCERFATDLIEKLSADYKLDSHMIKLTLNVGMAAYPKDAEDAKQLLQRASIAMSIARRTKRPFLFYDANNDEHHINRQALIGDLRRAIENNELEMYFQPQLSLSDHRVTGAEALLRWNHPRHGFIRPDKVVEMADKGGLINDLCMWVIGQTMSHCKRWHGAGFPLMVSINLAVQNLEYGNLCPSVQQNLDKWQLDPAFVMFEITESGMMHNPGRSIDVLNRLHDMGVKLSIDDFGTGFSSLSYLQKLPVDEVKIDKSFVMNMDSNDSDRVIVESVISLGHNLGLSVVAEGVETNRVLRSLRRMNCDVAQGFLISKPKPGDEFFKWLRKNSVIRHDLLLEKNSG